MQKHLCFHLLSIFKHALQTRLCFKKPKVEGRMQLPINLQRTFLIHGGILTTYLMCRNEKKQKRLQQVKRGPNCLTPLCIAPQSW